MSNIKELKINEVIADDRLNIRSRRNPNLVETYVAVIDELPPIAVFNVKSEYLIADGFHRYEAHLVANRKAIKADVKDGTWQDAERYAAIANTKHGARLSTPDLHSAVRRLLSHGLSREDVAKELSIGVQGVTNVRRADKVRAKTDIDDLSHSVALAVGRADERYWKQIAEASVSQHWGVVKTREIATAVAEGRFTQKQVEMLCVDVSVIDKTNTSPRPDSWTAVIWGLFEATNVVRERARKDMPTDSELEDLKVALSETETALRAIHKMIS